MPYCRECKSEISYQARYCAYCGTPHKTEHKQEGSYGFVGEVIDTALDVAAATVLIDAAGDLLGGLFD